MRAVWDEENSKWWFSAVDIVAAITDSPNPISTILPTIENMPETTFDEVADDVVCQEFTLNINTFPYKMEFFLLMAIDIALAWTLSIDFNRAIIV